MKQLEWAVIDYYLAFLVEHVQLLVYTKIVDPEEVTSVDIVLQHFVWIRLSEIYLAF